MSKHKFSMKKKGRQKKHKKYFVLFKKKQKVETNEKYHPSKKYVKGVFFSKKTKTI